MNCVENVKQIWIKVAVPMNLIGITLAVTRRNSQYLEDVID